jgi:proteasome lid subunit RPN8/RPN11
MELEYIVGETGHYMRKKNALIEAVVPVGSNPDFNPVEESLTFIGKKIPGNIFRAWQKFGQEVARRRKSGSEAALLLFYHPEKTVWSAYPPEQRLSAASVDFSGVTDAMKEFRKEHGKEWLCAGTFHTHPGGSSCPSSTDEKDEKDMDGIHIIVPEFGGAGEKNVTIHATASRQRYVFKKTSHVIDFSVGGVDAVPEKWFSQIKEGGGGRNVTYPRGYVGDYHGGYGYGRGYSSTVRSLDLKDIKKVLKRLNFSKEERGALLKDNQDIFTEACEVLAKIAEVRTDFATTNPPITDFEIRRMAGDLDHCLEMMGGFIQAMGIRLMPKDTDPTEISSTSSTEEEEAEDTGTVPVREGITDGTFFEV